MGNPMPMKKPRAYESLSEETKQLVTEAERACQMLDINNLSIDTGDMGIINAERYTRYANSILAVVDACRALESLSQDERDSIEATDKLPFNL